MNIKDIKSSPHNQKSGTDIISQHQFPRVLILYFLPIIFIYFMSSVYICVKYKPKIIISS